MLNLLASRWPLILLAAAAIGLVSCGSVSKDPPPVANGVSVRIIVQGVGNVLYGPNGEYGCFDDCVWTLPGDEPARITANNFTNSVFVAWEGPCDTLSSACTRVFEEGDTVTAKFAEHALRLDLTGDGEGTFTIIGGDIFTTCDADCGLAVPPLRYAITYDPQGTTGTTLDAWGGACEAEEDPRYCQVQVAGSTDVSKRWVRPPVAIDEAYETTRNAALTVDAPGVLANADDTDDDVLTASRVSGPQNGSLTLAPDGGFTYTPAGGYVGPDAFRYRVRDAFGSDDTADVTITVINRAPVAVDDAYAPDHNTEFVVDIAQGVLANDTDPDGDTLTATLVDDVAFGDLAFNADGSFSYTFDADFAGTDTFTYTATDGIATSKLATVTITVTNQAPTAVDDDYDTGVNTQLVVAADEGVLANDEDLDGDPLTATLIDDVKNGTLVFADDGSFTYTPDLDYTGPDTFTYVANDGIDDSNVATVSITVE